MRKSHLKAARVPAIAHSASPLKVIYQKVEADSRFSLYCLHVVDTAVNVATVARNSAETAEQAVKQVLVQLTESDGFDQLIDPKGKLASMSASAEKVVKEAIVALQGFDGALGKSVLSEEDAAEVSVNNDEAISALQRLHDLMVDLRWTIIEHDANLEEPAEKTFDNAEDLIADLKSH